MSSRYDVPRAAPEPLRAVQLFVNSIDREHELDWLDDWFAEHGPVAEPERARPLREAFRALALANNGVPLDPAAVETLNAAAARLSLRLDADGRPQFARRRRLARPARRDRLRRDARRFVGPAQGLPQLPLVVLRRLAEPVGDLVLDAALRQSREDAHVPHAPSSGVGSRACGRARRSVGSRSRPARVGASPTSARSPDARRTHTASRWPSSGCSRRRSCSRMRRCRFPRAASVTVSARASSVRSAWLVILCASLAGLMLREAWFAILVRLVTGLGLAGAFVGGADYVRATLALAARPGLLRGCIDGLGRAGARARAALAGLAGAVRHGRDRRRCSASR